MDKINIFRKSRQIVFFKNTDVQKNIDEYNSQKVHLI